MESRGGGFADLREALIRELNDQRLAKNTIRRRMNMFDRLGDPLQVTKADVLAIIATVDQGTRLAYLSDIRQL